MHIFLSKLFPDRKYINSVFFQISNDFLGKTTRGNTMNLRWSPLNWHPKFSLQKEVQFPPSSWKDCDIQHINNHCCPCLGMGKRDAVYQCMHRVLCLPCSLSVASQRVAPLLCCACPALVKESPELGKPSGAGGHDPVGRKPAARADISRCLQEAENDRAKS